jgi:hypothetical protein
MKKFLILLTVFGVVSTGKAQFIAKDVGASIFIGNAKLTKSGETVTLQPSFYGVSWYPRYMVTDAVSIGAPLTLGFSGSFNSREGGSFSFGLDAPITVDYNFGYGAAGGEEETDASFGGFVGAGFGYTKTAEATPDNYNTTIWSEADFSASSSYGPLVHAGVRFPIQQGERSVTLRLSFKKGLESTKYNFFGGTLLYGF